MLWGIWCRGGGKVEMEWLLGGLAWRADLFGFSYHCIYVLEHWFPSLMIVFVFLRWCWDISWRARVCVAQGTKLHCARVHWYVTWKGYSVWRIGAANGMGYICFDYWTISLGKWRSSECFDEYDLTRYPWKQQPNVGRIAIIHWFELFWDSTVILLGSIQVMYKASSASGENEHTQVIDQVSLG